jgi:AGCS family alanine or glycine:cation symporter
MDALLKIVDTINAYLSDYILIVLLVGIGLFYSIRTRFVQVRCFGEGMKKVFGNFSLRGGKQSGGISSFQALSAAIAAQVGTGNIVGACGAILVGGPGAIFWMWLIAFFGMATNYAEAVLAQSTKRVLPDGTVLGGPVYYIKRAFSGRFGKILAGFFSVACILALGFMGTMVQSNSIAQNMNAAFHIPTWVIGLVVAGISAFVFLGGIQRLASVTEKIVPVMAILYIVGCLVVIGFHIKAIPETFALIFKEAFVPSAAVGATVGIAIKNAISQGAKRGLFSNEAGMGSTPHAHAVANVKRPHDQGVAAMIGVFIDTFIVLTLTALVVISVLFVGNGPLANGARPDGISGANMAQIAFASVFGETFGGAFIAICLFFFAFSTILSWNFFGKVNANDLFGKKALPIYSTLAIGFIFLGALLSNDLVWGLTDLFNNLMVIPNVIALSVLSGIVVSAVRGAKKKRADKSGDASQGTEE